MGMIKFLKAMEQRFSTPIDYSETDRIASMLANMYPERNARVLDVGCGYGRKILALGQAGFRDVTGVEINQALVDLAGAKGLNCVTPDELERGARYDIVLMSHIIEHFQPDALIGFIDSHLDFLKKDGFLVVVCPVWWNGFYRDFDHIKPYSPWGILSVFDGTGFQVQYYGKNRLQLEGVPVVFRMPYQISAYKNFVMQKKNIFEMAVQFIFNLVFIVSGARFGKPNAWMGVFRKVS